MLMEGGADPNCIYQKYRTDDPITPLDMAVGKGYISVVRLLLQAGANPQACPLVLTPLMLAASLGHLDIVKLLLAWRADVNAVDTQHGRTVLHWACTNTGEGRGADCVEVLVWAGCDVWIKAKTGETAQQLAEESGCTGVLERLRAVEAQKRMHDTKVAEVEANRLQQSEIEARLRAESEARRATEEREERKAVEVAAAVGESLAQEAKRARAERAAERQAESQAIQVAKADQAREAVAAAAALAQEAVAELPAFVEVLVAGNSEVGIKAAMKALQAHGGWAAVVQKAAVKETLHMCVYAHRRSSAPFRYHRCVPLVGSILSETAPCLMAAPGERRRCSRLRRPRNCTTRQTCSRCCGRPRNFLMGAGQG
jgi:hypothetical protein